MKPGSSFEDYVHFVYNTLLNLRGENIQVSRRTTFRLKTGESYEIDIFYEFSHVGVRHRVAIECKDWRSPVDQGRVLEFHQKIKNIGDDMVGVLVSRSGYQSGAIVVAERHGILALKADDIPSIFQVLSNQIRSSLIPEAHCLGEPFWYIAELSDTPKEGTGTYYAFPEGSPVKIPLFLSRQHAKAHWERLPDKKAHGVFGMPQYKLRALLGFAIPQKITFGIVLGYPFPDGQLQIMPIDAKRLKEEYLTLELSIKE